MLDARSAAEKGASRTLSIGKYRLFARLGTGGMAEVYLAVAQGAMNVNRLVVIKRLRDEQGSDPGSRQMFLNEARLAARLNHPNVIQTFEAGNQDGTYFLAMEYVDGQPLSRVLTRMRREGRTIEPRLAARICADALSGLHYAHELEDFDGSALEIVHRDVSPQNVMLTYEGRIKLVDFGIAKAVGTTQTAHGVFKGKVAFMAPEQLVGDGVDRRADLFAAGIVLWETVTGKSLMAEDSPAKTLYNLMNKKIPLASEVNPTIDAALDQILARSLERDPALRYQTAREMRDALEAYIASSGPNVTPEQIGDLMKSLFKDTRDKVQGQIKAQLAALSFRNSDPALRAAQDLSHTQIRATAPVLIDLGEAFGADTALSNAGLYRVSTGSGTMPVAEAAPASRTKRLAFVAWVGITVLAAGASGLALVRSQRAPLVVVPAPAPAAPPAALEPKNASSAPLAVATSAATSVANHESAASAASAVGAPEAAAVLARPPPVASAAAPPPPKPAWTPPPPPARAPAATATIATAPVEAPRPAAQAAQPASPKTQQPQPEPQGRTFRRDL